MSKELTWAQVMGALRLGEDRGRGRSCRCPFFGSSFLESAGRNRGIWDFMVV